MPLNDILGATGHTRLESQRATDFIPSPVSY